jgi:hypothetical protein
MTWRALSISPWQLEYFLEQQTLAGKRNPAEAASNAPLG